MLISASLVSIILIQISWIKSMVKVEEKQFEDKVNKATGVVCNELSEYKGNMLSQGSTAFPWKQDQFTLEMLRPNTVGSRFTAGQFII